MKPCIKRWSSIFIAVLVLTAFLGMSTPAIAASPAVAPTKDYSAIGFKLMDQEMAFLFKKGLTAPKIEKVLGKPDAKTKAQLWGADGLEHQEWTYKKKGLVLGFAKEEDKVQTLWSVTLTKSSKLKTSKGISVGSTRQAVLKAYGSAVDPSDAEATATGKNVIVAGTVYGGLIFQIEKERVVGIYIGASAE